MGSGVEVELDLCEEDATVVLDPSQLEMAILNLAVNSRDAMPDGGKLKIATGTRFLDEDRDLPEGDYVVLTVSDTGPGLPADELQRIQKAEPLPTVARARHGSGYGLPLVRVLARAAGATVEIGSRPGQGTRVWLTFPRDRLVESGTGPRN